MDISNKIEQIRKAKRIKQIEISNALEMNNSYYARLEKRGNKLTIEQVEKIAGALGVSVAELLGLDISAKVEQVNNASEKDRDIEDLKKRVLELEDRVKDKEGLRLNLEKDLEHTNNNLATWIYSYTHGLVEELKAPLFTSRGNDLDLIPLMFHGMDNLNVFLAYNSEDFDILNSKKGLYPIPFIKSENLKDVVLYGFGKYFDITIKMYILCLPHIKDDRFIKVWNEVKDELFNQSK
jgi:transcriptional regulator with XRE-family HTH domain